MIKILRAQKATVKLKETRRKLSHRVHSSSTKATYVRFNYSHKFGMKLKVALVSNGKFMANEKITHDEN